jgi:putative transposase
MERLARRGNRRIQHSLPTASRFIIDVLLPEGIGTLMVGKNLLWKQEVNLGKVNHQQLVQIPQARFIDLLSGHRPIGRHWRARARRALHQQSCFA